MSQKPDHNFFSKLVVEGEKRKHYGTCLLCSSSIDVRAERRVQHWPVCPGFSTVNDSVVICWRIVLVAMFRPFRAEQVDALPVMG